MEAEHAGADPRTDLVPTLPDPHKCGRGVHQEFRSIDLATGEHRLQGLQQPATRGRVAALGGTRATTVVGYTKKHALVRLHTGQACTERCRAAATSQNLAGFGTPRR